MSDKLDALARRLLRAELAARGCRDIDRAEAALSPRLRFDPDSFEHTAIGMFSPKAGHPNMGLDEFLAVTMKSEPELFGGQTDVPGRVGQPPSHNPFLPGPRFNLTEGMQIFAADPTLGRELMMDAGYSMKDL